MFNGNIVTNYKLNQFKVWVDAFNKIYKTNIDCIENKHELTLNNAWLSGFTDAEGCFTSSTSVSKSTGQTITTVRYVISQKDDIGFSKDLADKINGYVTHVKSYNGYNTVVNFGKLNKILLYLKNYPLQTKKFISYKRWLKIYGLVKNKKHQTSQGKIIIKFLSKLIN
ncbi:GIY endonuclease (mitochondrion) [Colletotrichum graminicola]|nr:GIY endonuclease [Colletotrichum graminicola]WDK23857.1 GIY endonuclease [Colletotrichum graminicola]